jgi:large subunit ribosomal protein L1
MSFTDEQLIDNLQHFADTLEKVRPASTKGAYIKKFVISGSMTPGIEIAV